MGKPDHRRERVTRAVAKKNAEDLNAKATRMKAAYIAKTKADIEEKAARADLKDALVSSGANVADSIVGPLALQHTAGARSIDWEALARAHVPSAKVEEVLPSYTSIGAGSTKLILPTAAWAVEAKSAGAAKRSA